MYCSTAVSGKNVNNLVYCSIAVSGKNVNNLVYCSTAVSGKNVNNLVYCSTAVLGRNVKNLVYCSTAVSGRNVNNLVYRRFWEECKRFSVLQFQGGMLKRPVFSWVTYNGIKRNYCRYFKRHFLQVGSGVWFTMLPLQDWFCKKPWKKKKNISR